jgi:methionine sulfoxide reductase catalytic subunit
MSQNHHDLYFPADRRLRVWFRLSSLALLLSPLALLAMVAWAQYLAFGLPQPPVTMSDHPVASNSPHGFPLWLRLTHYFNLLLMVLLIRSGLSILFDHPRLYWSVHCTPGSEWARFTPIAVPRDRLWTAKDDARYVTPWLGLPGGRHTIGMARHWHFFCALFWILNGLVFLTLLFAADQWKRLVPTSPSIVPEAWAVFVHYTTFHMPVEPDGFYRYNPLQQLAYFGVVFLMAPLSILTGLSMSPAVANRFRWFPELFGNRQVGRSLHFLLLLAYLNFVGVHVGMVVITGLLRNLNHITVGTDDSGPAGLILTTIGLGLVAGACVLAHRLAWKHPRFVQHVSRAVVSPVMGLFLDHLKPRAPYKKEEISPFFWPNGKLPTSDEYKALAAGGFRDYRLRVHGLVENPVELSMDDLRALGSQEQITMHNCIQGWSGIAEWGGLPLARLIELVRPRPEAKVVVFWSFGEGIFGGTYYDSHSMANATNRQSLLAWEMNWQPLNEVHGAPLRLRVENQLGFKQVKWIQSIEFVASEKDVGKGEGGYNEDNEYFGYLADI